MRKENYRLEYLRRSVLGRLLRSNEKELEFIVKTNHRNYEKLEREIERFGRVTHLIETLPYISFVCDISDARKLSDTFHKLSRDKAYTAICSSIYRLDVSSEIGIPIVEHVDFEKREGPLWNLEEIGAYDAKEYATGSGIKIAIIDTGVDYRHPEVSSRFGDVKGYDVVTGKSDPMDFNGHGTHVAGISFGQNYGIASNATAYAVRVLDEEGRGSEADTVAGLDWAYKNGADVVNLSLGSAYASAALEDMCYYLANKGVIIVAAAGNNGFGASYPAAFGDPVIAVAAVNKDKEHPEFSNIYKTNDEAAPGVEITSSYIGGYATLSGTSMAAPHVSGSAALALSVMTRNVDVEELMEDTSEKLESGQFPERDVFGAGLIRVDRMVKALMEKKKAGFKGFGREILEAIKEVVYE